MPSPRDKGISFREGHSEADNPSIDELQKKITVLDQKNIELDIQVTDLLSENAKLKSQVFDLQKDRTLKIKQISDLQDHFNLLTSSYFDLKKKLEEELGEKFKTFADESIINLHTQAHPISTSFACTSRVVDRFEEEPVQAPNVVALKRARLDESAKKGQLLFKRSSNQNALGDQPKIIVTDLEEKRFRDIYGGRSGIISWGFSRHVKYVDHEKEEWQHRAL